MLKTKISAVILINLLISGCQQFQSGVNSIDSSIKSLNEKLPPKKDNYISNDKNLSISSAKALSGLGKICSDYDSNTTMSEKKWTSQVVRIQNVIILRVSEFNSARTLGANIHGEYGILFRTSDTIKCMGVLHIQYYAGLENDIAKYKKDETISVIAKINSFQM